MASEEGDDEKTRNAGMEETRRGQRAGIIRLASSGSEEVNVPRPWEGILEPGRYIRSILLQKGKGTRERTSQPFASMSLRFQINDREFTNRSTARA